MAPSPRARRLGLGALVIPLLVLLFLGSAPRRAIASPPLLGVEARLGGGLLLGGTNHKSGWRYAPITASALVDYAIVDKPRVHLFGEVIYEGLGRAAFGLAGGLRFKPFDNGVRVGLGVIAMFSSYTHGGVVATAGQCLPFKSLRFCLDLQGEVFVFGDDLPRNGVDGQLKLVLSAGFDAL